VYYLYFDKFFIHLYKYWYRIDIVSNLKKWYRPISISVFLLQSRDGSMSLFQIRYDINLNKLRYRWYQYLYKWIRKFFKAQIIHVYTLHDRIRNKDHMTTWQWRADYKHTISIWHISSVYRFNYWRQEEHNYVQLMTNHDSRFTKDE